jgi:pentatricopeptide repeat protein
MHLFALHQSRERLEALLHMGSVEDIGTLCSGGQLKEALKMLQVMHKVDSDAYVSLLQACININSIAEGKCIQTHIIKTGFELHVDVGNKLLIMYAKYKRIEDARQVFDKMPERDVVTWTAMIGGYGQSGQEEHALRLFIQTLDFGVKPNQYTFGSVISACARLEVLEEGKQVHGYTIKIGLDTNAFVGSALVDMYAKCGSIDDARKVFNKMPEQNVVASTAMVTGYVKNERVEEASELFWRMPERNVISWNAMIAGYAQNGHNEEALELFSQMRCSGNVPNQNTFPSVLSACGNLAALGKGKHVHAHIVKKAFKLSVFVGNSLVTMYAKCGNIEDARNMFDRVPERNVVTWNAVISGYAQHGEGKEALLFYEQMQKEGMGPNDVTFLCVLSACNHAGLVDEGCHYFYTMCEDHGIAARAEHYACMVDLLGRSGRLDEAEDFIKKMPLEPDAGLWKSLLGACRIHGNTVLGQHAAEQLFKLGAQHTSTYVLLSNIYAEAGRWDEVAKVRRMMKDRGVKKTPGFSWIEIKNTVHTFVIGDRSHSQTEDIYAMLEKLSREMKDAGYVPGKHTLLYDVED